MFEKIASTVRSVSDYLTSPGMPYQAIADVARGIRIGAKRANEATSGLLQQAVEMLPGGKTGLKVADIALRGTEALARHLGRRFSPMAGQSEP